MPKKRYRFTRRDILEVAAVSVMCGLQCYGMGSRVRRKYLVGFEKETQSALKWLLEMSDKEFAKELAYIRKGQA